MPRSATAPVNRSSPLLGCATSTCAWWPWRRFSKLPRNHRSAQENGAPFVLSRATRDVHAKFLLRNGADDVIYPEKQMASWAAVRYSSDHIFDYVELTAEYSIFETAVPAAWVGHTIMELNVRQKNRINILATKRNGKLDPLPGAAHCFQADETMLILGGNHDIQRFLH